MRDNEYRCLGCGAVYALQLGESAGTVDSCDACADGPTDEDFENDMYGSDGQI